MIFTHTILSLLLAGSTTAAPAPAPQLDHNPARSQPMARASSFERRDLKPDVADPYFAPCFASPYCDVIWSDKLQLWRSNVSHPPAHLSPDHIKRQHTPLGKRGEAQTKVRLGDSKQFFGDMYPRDVLHNALYNICNNWGCIGTWDQSVYTSRVELSNNGGTDSTGVVRVTCEGSWSDNWNMRDGLAELGKEAYNNEVQQEWQDDYCQNNNLNGLNFYTCYQGINKYYHSDLMMADNYNGDGVPMGNYVCRIQGVQENAGAGMCGFFWNLATILTGFIPTIGPYASAMLGSVPSDGICS